MFVSEATPQNLLTSLQQLQVGENEQAVVFLGEKSSAGVEEIWQVLQNESSVPFVGAFFPAVISGTIHSETGAVVWKAPSLGAPVYIQGLNRPEISLPSLLSELSQKNPHSTMLVIVDGLSLHLATFLVQLHEAMGANVRYVGGGAGSLTLKQKPCLFGRDMPPFQDGAFVLPLSLRSNLGVRHGWEHLAGPLVANHTEKNRIYQLNWQPAFEVYRQAIEEDSGAKIERENFFDIAKGYPFGIVKEGQECIVRDPILVDEDGALVCVGEVPANAVLSILKGTTSSLLSGAEQSAKDAQREKAERPYCGLVFDCISRVLFLGENFGDELKIFSDTFSEEKLTCEGALTLGEIASYGEGLLEFFNKTVVSAKLYFP